MQAGLGVSVSVLLDGASRARMHAREVIPCAKSHALVSRSDGPIVGDAPGDRSGRQGSLDRTAANRDGASHDARGQEAEAALLARARSGDGTAFEEIVRLHSDSVFRVVAGHLGSGEAEDASQEVFLQVHRGLRSFEGRSLLSTWIFRIATNVALKRLRRKRRRPPARSIEEGESVVDMGPAPDAALDVTELRSALLRALDRLPEEQRAVVVLRGIEGLPFEDVARVLGIVRPTAESRMARAKERLRSLLRPWLEGRDSLKDPAKDGIQDSVTDSMTEGRAS